MVTYPTELQCKWSSDLVTQRPMVISSWQMRQNVKPCMNVHLFFHYCPKHATNNLWFCQKMKVLFDLKTCVTETRGVRF